MQHDNADDPWGFWESEPTRQLKRTPASTTHARPTPARRAPVATRVHGDTGMVPVIRVDRGRPPTMPGRQINPVTARVGLMAAAIVLMVPIAISLHADAKPALRAADITADNPVAVAVVPPPPAPTEAPVASATDPTTTTTVVATTAAPVTPPPTEAVAETPAPTEPPTTAPKAQKKATPKPATTVAAPAAAAQSVAKVSCGQSYTIAKGDAWSTIAARAKVSMKNLLAVNGATTKTVLLPGKELCLPEGAAAPGPPATPAPAATQPPATQPPATQPKPAATTPPTTQPKPAPTTAPPPPAPSQPPSPPNTYSRDQVIQIIRDTWPDDQEDKAIAIATRESSLNPTVKNYCCYGLFQIYFEVHKSWLANIGVTSAAQLYDPHVNANAALALYNRSGGWGPWGG